MRKAAGLLCALSLLIPVGVIASSVAGAAASPTTQCKTLSGKQTYSPALPVITSKATVNTTIASTSKLGGCVGGGVTSGVATSKSTMKNDNCALFAKNFGKPTKGTASIKWSNGKTSTVATTLTSKSKAGTSPVIAVLVSKFTAGLFAGHTSTVTLKATGNAGAKTCISAGLSFFTFVNSGPIVSK
jgi:hypothetical protein